MHRNILLRVFHICVWCELCRLPLVSMPLNYECAHSFKCIWSVRSLYSRTGQAKWRHQTCFTNNYILFNIGFFLSFISDAVSILIAFFSRYFCCCCCCCLPACLLLSLLLLFYFYSGFIDFIRQDHNKKI